MAKSGGRGGGDPGPAFRNLISVGVLGIVGCGSFCAGIVFLIVFCVAYAVATHGTIHIT